MKIFLIIMSSHGHKYNIKIINIHTNILLLFVVIYFFYLCIKKQLNKNIFINTLRYNLLPFYFMKHHLMSW
ncbi:hypothetical protein XBP1_950003 [Xenorhabdus bovienii str. puntauvense]|uniref:Uncharacterized protein n=2 Tax=Xenorhabdus bovienii TaxID=40576 RepID=A0A077NKS3_XENBV|nr:hypothetical protein XBFFR1_2330002 [Xenorhabdus bovienii str. feltiae France]CDG91825.1 hypothetical protein XBFFL1_1860002 [Xenorhabdus bovienii str. feltiae Florida]CDG99394.1 hypothetical protein XBP1_950003 [Xenorhabdus bovienii str. puntauvense]CDH03263.1 hypothetical protein XBFM1_670001 [Xenorhabdus bovienii str. feltiae Moldova]